MVTKHSMVLLALPVCLLIALIDLMADLTGYSSLIACTILTFVIFHHYRHTAIGAILLFVATSIYAVPMLSLLVAGVPVNMAWYALYLIAGYIFLALTVKPQTLENRGAQAEGRVAGARSLMWIVIVMSAGMVLSNVEALSGFIFLACWGLALVFLERLNWSTRSVVLRYTGVAIIIGSVLLFAALLWTGGGRLIMISLLLGPVLIAGYYGPFRVSGHLLAGLGAALVFVGHVIRYGFSDGLSGIAADSGATHAILTTQLYETPSITQNVTGFWDQYLLMFLNWVPRSVWPEKPLGVNYLFVDVYIGRQGLGELHSTALGYFGEQIYYWGMGWPVGAVITTASLVLLRLLVVRCARAFTAPVVAMDVWLLTFFWGGMAVWASRVWFALVPALVLAVMLQAASSRRGARPTAPRLRGNFAAEGK